MLREAQAVNDPRAGRSEGWMMGRVKAVYPGDGDPDVGPGVDPETDGETDATSYTLEVDGEVFALRPDRYGGTDYTWLSGPNPGYGFAVSPTPDPSPDEHREHIRGFLSGIDPSTGYLDDA